MPGSLALRHGSITGGNKYGRALSLAKRVFSFWYVAAIVAGLGTIAMRAEEGRSKAASIERNTQDIKAVVQKAAEVPVELQALRSAYATVLAQNKALRAENGELRRRLGYQHDVLANLSKKTGLEDEKKKR